MLWIRAKIARIEQKDSKFEFTAKAITLNGRKEECGILSESHRELMVKKAKITSKYKVVDFFPKKNDIVFVKLSDENTYKPWCTEDKFNEATEELAHQRHESRKFY